MMKTLGRYGVLSTEQAAKMFFPGTALTTVRRRLRALEKADHIFRVSGLDNGGVAWAVTKMSAQKLGCVHPARHFNRNSLTHDVLLSEVRYTLESTGVGEKWVPEHVLKIQTAIKHAKQMSERHFVPDAIFSVRQRGENRVVALELELTGKNRKRYEAILERYKYKKTLWAVWYLVANESLGRLLESVWKEVNFGKRNDLLIWSELDSVLSNPREALVRCEHFSVPLKNHVTMKPLQDPALSGALPQSRAVVEVAANSIGAIS